MESTTFRKLAESAINRVESFLDEFPELYIEVRIKTKLGTVVVALADDVAVEDDE